MTLIVEDGTNVPNAESYASVAQADAHHAGRSSAAWLDLDTDVKERCLRESTDYITQRYSGRWGGMRSLWDQALDWPRYNVPLVDSLNGYRPNDAVPPELVKACAELAYKTNTTPLTTDTGRETLSETVDAISVTYAQGASRQTQYPAVEGWLKPLLVAPSSIKITRA